MVTPEGDVPPPPEAGNGETTRPPPPPPSPDALYLSGAPGDANPDAGTLPNPMGWGTYDDVFGELFSPREEVFVKAEVPEQPEAAALPEELTSPTSPAPLLHLAPRSPSSQTAPGTPEALAAASPATAPGTPEVPAAAASAALATPRRTGKSMAMKRMEKEGLTQGDSKVARPSTDETAPQTARKRNDEGGHRGPGAAGGETLG